MTDWRPKLIPRKTLTGRRRTEVLDAYNIATITNVAITVENAGVQPASGFTLQTLPSGYRDKEAFKLFTTTEILALQEGSDQYADQIELFTGRWFTAINVAPWDYGVQSHYEVLLVETNER